MLGHASCGGVRAVFDDAEPLTKIDFVGKWMSQITPVSENLPRTGDRATDIQRLEWAVVGHSLANLMTFPSIRARIQQGKLELHGAYFGVATGLLFLRDPATGEFSPCHTQAAG